ncbi:hypothetical protein C8R45DRAFT_921693 [Mycena sanguinolenta]|nr:hypothetical protein C8R45DRAFT_921693 [Mycena sanguinolenta]
MSSQSTDADTSIAAAAHNPTESDFEQTVQDVMRSVTRALDKARAGAPLDSETAALIRSLGDPRLTEIKRILNPEVAKTKTNDEAQAPNAGYTNEVRLRDDPRRPQTPKHFTEVESNSASSLPPDVDWDGEELSAQQRKRGVPTRPVLATVPVCVPVPGVLGSGSKLHSSRPPARGAAVVVAREKMKVLGLGRGSRRRPGGEGGMLVPNGKGRKREDAAQSTGCSWAVSMVVVVTGAGGSPNAPNGESRALTPNLMRAGDRVGTPTFEMRCEIRGRRTGILFDVFCPEGEARPTEGIRAAFVLENLFPLLKMTEAAKASKIAASSSMAPVSPEKRSRFQGGNPEGSRAGGDFEDRGNHEGVVVEQGCGMPRKSGGKRTSDRGAIITDGKVVLDVHIHYDSEQITGDCVLYGLVDTHSAVGTQTPQFKRGQVLGELTCGQTAQEQGGRIAQVESGIRSGTDPVNDSEYVRHPPSTAAAVQTAGYMSVSSCFAVAQCEQNKEKTTAKSTGKG